MKYLDKKFIAFKERKSDDEYDDTRNDRQIRRKNQKRNYLFYVQRLSKDIEKIWWDNLKESDKSKLIELYYLQSDYMKSSKSNHNFYSYDVFETWEDWFTYIKAEFKPNMAGLRNDKLKMLGI